MSWNELNTRTGQEVNKRLDWLRYRAGLQPGKNRLNRQCTRIGNFFFPKDGLLHRTRLLKEHLKHETENLIEAADEICRHRFRLLGYRDLAYGEEIDWHLDAVHGKRAALKPWFKIRFLDFEAVGDHKVI